MARSGQEIARESDYLGNVRKQTQGFTAAGSGMVSAHSSGSGLPLACKLPWVICDVTLGLYDHDLPPMSEELDLRMRRAAEELWSIGSELLKQPNPSAEANGGDVGSAACHELQAAVDQFRHLIWTKIEEANAPSALGTEEALLALRLRRSAEMLRLAGTALKDPRFATDRVLGFVGEIQQAVYGIWDTVGQGTLNAYRAAPLRRSEGAGGS